MADTFANVAYASVTETGANTLTFEEIQSGVSIFEKNAWIIHEIDYYPAEASIQGMTGAGDTLTIGLVASNKVSSIDLSDAAVVDLIEIDFQLRGAAANAMFLFNPIRRIFDNLPGGGLIVTPRPLYLAAQGNNLGAAATARARIYFTVKTLKAEEYWELVEARRLVE